MNGMRFLLSAHLFVFLCTACSASGTPSLHAKLDGGEVSVVIRSIRDAKELHVNGVVVYGDIVVTSEYKLKSADFGCISLLAAEKRSGKPYVNSVGRILTDRYPADADGAIRASLYWIFVGQQMDEFNPKVIALVTDRSAKSCLTPKN